MDNRTVTCRKSSGAFGKWPPFSIIIAVLLLFGRVVMAGVDPASGPAVGGNTVVITGADLGNGSDITNVTVGGVAASIVSQTSNSVTVVLGAGSGAGNVVVQSTSCGQTQWVNGYTYNPAGMIFGDALSWGSTSNYPGGRGELDATVVGGRIYAMGGYNGSWCSDVYSFNPMQPTQGWVSVASMPVGRACHAVVTVNGKIYSIGGQNGSPQAAVYVYDPTNPGLGWSSIASLPVPLCWITATVVNGKIYTLGGNSSAGVQSAVYEYDPQLPGQGWRLLNNLPAPRNGLAAVVVDGRIYAVGGSTATTPQSTVFVCDPQYPESGWMSVSNMPEARSTHAAVVYNGKIYVMGGYDATVTVPRNTVYVYDPQRPAQGWLSAGNMPGIKGEAPAVIVNDKVYMISGETAPCVQSTSVFEGSFTSGLSPSSGPMEGGTTVTIKGLNLGNGSDITDVTLCGISVSSIVSQSATQVVVVTGAAGVPVSNGVVQVCSTSYGVTTASNAFSYALTLDSPAVLSATGVTLQEFNANWSPVGGAENYLLDVSSSSNFTSCLSGYNNLNVGSATTWPVSGLNAGNTYYYRLRSQGAGSLSSNSAVMAVATLAGSLSVTNGPAGGGNTLTITGSGLGNGSDITNVTVGGVAASIVSQTSTSVTVVVGAGSGAGNVVVQSVTCGQTQWVNAYTYNPAGMIFGDDVLWCSVSNYPVARGVMASAVAGGRIYTLGGYNGSWSSQVYSYDPVQPAQGWVSVASLPVARGLSALTTVGGRVYSLGGELSGSVQSAVYVYDSAEPGAGWLSVSNMPVALTRHAAVSVGSKIYVLGGQGPVAGFSSAVYVYDTQHPSMGWQLLGNMPNTRDTAAVSVLDGVIYVMGGQESNVVKSTAWCYDTTNPGLGWMSISNMPAKIVGSVSVAANGKVYVVGGAAASTNPPPAYVYLKSAYVYDPSKPMQGWLSVSDLPAIRAEASGVSVNGKIYLISGATAAFGYVSSVFEGTVTTGVSPSSGLLAGGTTVTIKGINLGNGSDITNVTLCGVSVGSIVSQSSTQVVVVAGASLEPVSGGAVCLYSTVDGVVSRQNAYSYTGSLFRITASAGPNGSVNPSGVLEVMEGSSPNFVIQADEGHHVAEVLLDGQSVGHFSQDSKTFTYGFSRVAANHDLRATFNTAPVIGVTASPTNGVAPLRVLYDFTASSDTETNIVRCEVDKDGDGTFETVSEGVGRVIVEYGAPGQYTTATRVIDSYGASSTTSIPITVWGQAPTAILQPSAISGSAPMTVQFTGSNSVVAAGHQIVVYDWDFDGDGSYDLISRTGMASHVYSVPGTYEANLRVTDDQGLQDKAVVTITVTPPVLTPPLVALLATPDAGTIPLPVSFAAVVSNQQAIAEYRWDFDGDGSVDLRTASGTAAHTYSAVGMYQASVTVVDVAGLSGQGTITVSAREASSLRVWIVQPKLGGTVSGGGVTVNANAVPVSHVASVKIQYRADGGAWADIGGLMVPPPADFKTTWCVTNLANGTACDLQAIAMDKNGSAVTSEVVSVTVQAAGGRNPGDIDEGDQDGKHVKHESCDKDATAMVEVYDGTSVTVPVGTVDSNVTVEVELTGTNSNPNTGSAYGQANIQMNRKVSLEGQPDLNKPITITLPYSDTNHDGIVDGTTIPENTLYAYWFDTSDGKWKKPLTCEVDASANFVRITTYHLTEFGLFGSRNLLLPANGGMMRSCSFDGTNATSAASLTDGNMSSYWMSPASAPSQEFIYSFTNYQGAICSEAVIYNYGQGSNSYSRNYQIQVARDLMGTNFILIASGTLPASETPFVVEMGSLTCRVVRLVIDSGYGTEFGLKEFELHGALTADPNGNGMSDAWEMEYFGTIERTGFDDYDADDLNDINEYIHGSSPLTNDTDGDGMTDGWEVQYGFQVATNDAAVDSDGDGMFNLHEYIAGSDPTNSASVFRIDEPGKIGTWCQSVTWDDEIGDWTTGAWLRVEGMVFSWSTLPGRVYRLNSSTNLMMPWASVSPPFIGGSDAIFTNWSTNSAQRFYQIQVEKLP